MDMTGERRIPAPREKVWAALNDPLVLRACIPGCEKLEKTSDTDMNGTVAIKIGPIGAKFAGRVQLLDLDPPHAYRIVGEGQGGAAGFAKGGAAVTLVEDAEFTVLAYTVTAQVGGKIAQLGARLVDATAKSMADAFFDRFVAEVAGPQGTAADGAAGLAAPAPVFTPTPAFTPNPAPAPISLLALLPREPMGFPLVAWIGSVLFLFIFLLIFGSYVW